MSVERQYSGRSDAPLTAAGVQQAAAAAKHLAGAGIGVIITSPLLRTVQTAQEVATVIGAPVVTDDGFRETDFGAWEGLTFADVRERWPDEMAHWMADPQVAPPGGESFTDVSDAGERRAAPRAGRPGRPAGADREPCHADQDPGRGGPARPAAALYRMHLDLAALSEIDWYANGSAVLRSFNDTGYLS